MALQTINLYSKTGITNPCIEGGQGMLATFYWNDSGICSPGSPNNLETIANNNVIIYTDSSLENIAPTGWYSETLFPSQNITIFYKFEWGSEGSEGPWTGPFQCDPIPIPNFEVERNAKLDNVAKPLLRTNPKLTTNVKIVVNSKDELYLDSIDATDDLASTKYKKFPINPKGSYAYDLSRFYSKNKTPLEIAYTTKRRDSDFSVFSEYEKQIEEDYHYGTKMNYSKLYDEEFRMFAPIYVDLNMPKKFVIYRVNDPKDETNFTDSALDNEARIKKLIQKAEIVKVFDLTKKSNIGTYLRNYVQDQAFPKAPVTFSFEENEKTTYNGIDLVKGGFTKKAEYVYDDFVRKDKPLISANDFITDGFRRNHMVAANIINMEFLFDDPHASTYSVNRYIGLYVDDIEAGDGRVSTIRNGNIIFKSINSYMSSEYNYAAIPSYKMLNEMPILAYARAGEHYYKIDNTRVYDHRKLELKVQDHRNEIPGLLGIQYKGESVDIKNNPDRGFDFIKFKVVDIPNHNDRLALTAIKRESYRFTFIKFVSNDGVEISDELNNVLNFNTGADINTALSNLESVFITSPFADMYNLETLDNGFILTEKEANLLNLSPEITSTSPNGNVFNRKEIYSNVEIHNQSYYAANPDPNSPNYLAKGTSSGLYFSSAGNTVDIAIALTRLIKERGEFDAFNIGDEVYVSIKNSGYKILQHSLLVGRANTKQFLDISQENADSNNELGLGDLAIGPSSGIWDAYFFKGGNSKNKSVLINKETAPVINIGEYLPTMYKNRYNRVIDIVEDITDPNGDYLKIILTLENKIKTGEVRVFEDRNLKLGLFSAYSIYDMDFDFRDTSNSNLKELEYETVDQMNYTPYDDIDPTDPDAIDILSEDYEIPPSSYFTNLQPILSNETVDDIELQSIESEYDRLSENGVKEFAVTSRVVPNINKWVLKNGNTVRDEPYHLNANGAFGRTNFAPDLEVTERDRKAFTHEWFYIENLPDYLRFWQIDNTFSYVNFIKGFNLSKDLFKSVEHDYFDTFMVGEGHEINLSKEYPLSIDSSLFNINSYIKANLHKKYTIIDYGSSETFAKTIFKGLNVTFKSRKEFTNKVASEFVKNTEFNGYKFSILVKVNNQAANNSNEFEVIQNKKFKFVIFYITLNTSDIWATDLNRKLFYELKHQLSFDTDVDEYVYSDIKLSGALNVAEDGIFSGPGPYKINGIEDRSGSPTNFDGQIFKNSLGNYNKIIIDFGNIGKYEAQVFSVESDNELYVLNEFIKVGGDPNDPNDILDTTPLDIPDIKNATYTYIGGGFNAQQLIFDQLTAGNVANILNNNDSSVTYTTVETDGTINDNRFTINFDDGKEIIKKVDLTTTEDTDKPKSYKLLGSRSTAKLTMLNQNISNEEYYADYDKSKKIIGYDILETNPYYAFMVRHSGDYTIDLEPVVTFTDIYTHFKTNRNHYTEDEYEQLFEAPLYKHSLTDEIEIDIAKSYYNKFNRCGVAFNIGFIKDSNILGLTQDEAIVPQPGIHDLNWGKIKNHYYHKVNEINPNGVLKLTKSRDYLPLYPLIDEIAIDYKDVNVFKSSWEDGYYTRSLSGGNKIDVTGTFDTAEERSYLGSTVMKLQDAYFLTEFTVQYVELEEDLDDILRNSNNEADVVIYEDNQTLIADFYMDDVVYQKLSDLGALNTLTRFIDPVDSIGDKTTLSDDMQDYVNKNLIQAFTIDQIDLWVNRFKGSQSNILSTLSLEGLDDGGFTKDQSFTYKLHSDTPLNFRLIYNKRLGYSYNIRPMVKIQL